MNQKDVRKAGIERGFNIASWQDIPEIGDKVPRDLGWWGYEEVTHENQADVFLLFCSAAESNDREYSPFEFTAKEINDSKDPDKFWQVFDEGIEAGFLKNWRERKPKPEPKPKKKDAPSCDRCDPLMINGIFCHEVGCPNI